jgi:hypothetical protein
VAALEQGCWSVGGGFFFLNFVDGMPRILVQDSMGMSPSEVACSSLFIKSQSLVGDGGLLDLAMVKARPLFQRAARRR